MSTTAKFVFTRRRVLSSFVAAAVASASLTFSSCASARIPIPPPHGLRAAAAGYELQVLLDGVPARTFEHAGETYVLGQMGARYTLRVVNHTGRRIEAVVSVDGRDAIDGKTADVRSKRGYLVPAWGTADVDGWRLSRAQVAAFRFSSVADSYAARTGNAREVGVIGVAVFPERFAPAPQPRPIYAPPHSQTPPYPSPYQWRDEALGRGESPAKRGQHAEGSAANAAPPQAPAPESRRAAPSSSSAPAETHAQAESKSRADDEGGPSPRRRPGLGTEFGESVHSPILEVDFVRAHSSRPSVVLGARYNDREGLLALGIDLDGCCGGRDEDLAWRQSATPFPATDRRYAAPPSGWQEGCCLR